MTQTVTWLEGVRQYRRTLPLESIARPTGIQAETGPKLLDLIKLRLGSSTHMVAVPSVYRHSTYVLLVALDTSRVIGVHPL